MLNSQITKLNILYHSIEYQSIFTAPKSADRHKKKIHIIKTKTFINALLRIYNEKRFGKLKSIIRSENKGRIINWSSQFNLSLKPSRKIVNLISSLMNDFRGYLG